MNYPTVFRLRCSAGKRVSVFEANWLETGNPGTSDIGTMASSNNGTSSGKDFLIYMAPPGNEQNVKIPLLIIISHNNSLTLTSFRLTIHVLFR